MVKKNQKKRESMISIESQVIIIVFLISTSVNAYIKDSMLSRLHVISKNPNLPHRPDYRLQLAELIAKQKSENSIEQQGCVVREPDHSNTSKRFQPCDNDDNCSGGEGFFCYESINESKVCDCPKYKSVFINLGGKDVCVTGKRLYHRCYVTEQCRIMNPYLTCVKGRCACNPPFVLKLGLKCMPKRELGDACNPSEDCSTAFSACFENTCRCKKRFKEYKGHCAKLGVPRWKQVILWALPLFLSLLFILLAAWIYVIKEYKGDNGMNVIPTYNYVLPSFVGAYSVMDSDADSVMKKDKESKEESFEFKTAYEYEEYLNSTRLGWAADDGELSVRMAAQGTRGLRFSPVDEQQVLPVLKDKELYEKFPFLKELDVEIAKDASSSALNKQGSKSTETIQAVPFTSQAKPSKEPECQLQKELGPIALNLTNQNQINVNVSVEKRVTKPSTSSTATIPGVKKPLTKASSSSTVATSSKKPSIKSSTVTTAPVKAKVLKIRKIGKSASARHVSTKKN